LYPLPQILVFCLLAMLAGATSYRKMHEFIMAHFRRLSRLYRVYASLQLALMVALGDGGRQ
jgi:hypothetical protein